MLLKFTKTNKVLNIDDVNESISTDKTYTVLSLTTKNPGNDLGLKDIVDLLQSKENTSEFELIPETGKPQKYTGYTSIIHVVRRLNDYDSFFEIRLAPEGKTSM